jgi:cobalt/nickel transport system permease protein
MTFSLDPHSRADSPVHRLPAAAKLIAALAILVATVSTPWAFGPVAVVLLAAAALSRIPPLFLLKRLVLLEPLALGVAILALFQPHGGRIFALIVVKATLCLLTVILLSNTTPFAELLRVFRRARVPALLVTTLALMYRYLFVLIEESERMRRARACRTFAGGRGGAWKSMAAVVGRLFVRSTERAERIHAAMCARGWR